MPVWSEFVDVIYATLVCVSTALGGSMGLAIAVVSLATRVLLLPLTLRLAYRALEVQAAVKKIEPQLARVREKYKSDPRRVMDETARLYQANGIKLVDGGSLLGTALQAPIFLGLFSAIRRGLAAGGRFLWVRDLALPDAALAWCCALVAGLSVALGPNLPAAQRMPAIVVPALLTVVFLARMAAGISVYTLASSLVGLLQAILVRRRAARLAAA
jgi:YidC/Oxa1 family membrane protein insertase